MSKKLAKKVLKKYKIETLPIPKKEYKDEVFVLGFNEGAEFLSAHPLHFTAGAITGDITKKGYPIAMYLKVVGFEDERAPMRDWGMDLEKFKKHYSSRR